MNSVTTASRPPGRERRLRRLSGLVALLLVVAGVVATRATGPTSAAWTDPAIVVAMASSTSWTSTTGNPVVPGNSSTSVSNITWTQNNYTSSISVCFSAQVTTASATPVAWAIVIDTSQPPWNGVTTGYSQQGDGYSWADNTPSAGKIQISGGYTDNMGASATQPRTVSVCNSSLQPIAASKATAAFTTASEHGTWTDSQACIVTTVAGNGSQPFYFNWAASVDMQPAIARLVGGVSQIRADGVPLAFSPALSAAVSSYTASSQTASAIKASGAYSFTVCAYHY